MLFLSNKSLKCFGRYYVTSIPINLYRIDSVKENQIDDPPPRRSEIGFTCAIRRANI